jgi:hypothetical protein
MVYGAQSEVWLCVGPPSTRVGPPSTRKVCFLASSNFAGAFYDQNSPENPTLLRIIRIR